MQIRTAESVSPKHPDKMCDQISDAIVDFALHKDSKSRCAIETVGGHGKVYVTGELTCSHKEEVLNEIPYLVRSIGGVDHVEINIVAQSPEIAQGVDTGGAGDQGIMIGYACDDNAAMIPQEVYLSRVLNQYIFEHFPYDGKTQVTISGDKITSIVASFQNATSKQLVTLIDQFFTGEYDIRNADVFTNPAGDWSMGGFDADAGLTGRKLAVDNYGTLVPIGGGAFSGKDATKVDRSAAYMARKIAVDILRKRNAKEVYVSLAYAIGVAKPVMAVATVDGVMENLPDDIVELCEPKNIISTLGLTMPDFKETARYGHFGRGFVWDKPFE